VIFRVTGKAGAIRERQGVSNRGTSEERAWRLRVQDVQVNEFVFSELNLPDDHAGYPVGEYVDLIVDITARGGYLSVSPRGDWPRSADVTPLKHSA